MSAYANQVKAYLERYQVEVGGDGLLDPHAVAEWAYKNGLHKPSVRTVIDAIAADIAQVFREEYRTDEKGQRYRAKHAVRSKKDNKTMSLWADIDDDRAPRSHFVRSFGQRRQQIVGDCFQLKTDVDVYNAKNVAQEPIQVVLDFTYDVEELQLPFKGKDAA
ncbi:hypothetical protein KEX41_09340 [Burkholderia thailandensis]|uniref:hypothetical protein n=1 Tax=Burkholderia thailandensis TaxID=57975 RepID=UPI00192D6547|nr:hypothetical protein [Burkholderia thailandensis]MBS2127337.1 hypothetical protein [Burkholderia thailandensis]MBS2128419.1 hypothetical protein [Burkholderia thailandensis]QRA11217.1 hypothetical protein JMY07_00965 [Burkholderia thailandensis]QRA12231.1 hypothetical protein JMY07_06640 [Burkholderia thailandensis]